MYLTSLVLLAAAGASAHPSGHAHMHRHLHQKRSPVPEPNPAVGDLVTATIEGKVVTWTNTYDGKGSPFIQYNKPEAKPSPSPAPQAHAPQPPAPAPSANAPPAPSASSSPSAGSDSVSATGVKGFKPFCGGKPNSKRATAQEIAYTGNTGAPGNWGCNMQLVADAATADKYQYTAKFTNQDKNSQTCTCFNKIGPNGLIDGFFHEGITWNMAPGATQFVAFDSNTQGGCVCNSGSSLRKTQFGQFAGTWLELDFENTSNKGWSGADASSLVPQKYGLQVDGLQVCFKGTCSTIWPGGRGDNAYLGGMEDLDGVGLNIPPGKCQLEVKVGYNS